jgi:hypothetical protein
MILIGDPSGGILYIIIICLIVYGFMKIGEALKTFKMNIDEKIVEHKIKVWNRKAKRNVHSNYKLSDMTTKVGNVPVVIGAINCKLHELIYLQQLNNENSYPDLILNPYIPIEDVINSGDENVVNAIRELFIIRKYKVLAVGYHERAFDHTRVHMSNGCSVKMNGKWHSYDWNNGVFIESSKKMVDSMDRAILEKYRVTYKNWVAKHEVIDKIIVALLFGHRLRIKLAKRTYYDLLFENVICEMEKSVEEVLREHLHRENTDNDLTNNEVYHNHPNPIFRNPIVLDGIDIRVFTQPFLVTVNDPYGTSPYVKQIDPVKVNDLGWVEKTLRDSSMQLHFYMNQVIKGQGQNRIESKFYDFTSP